MDTSSYFDYCFSIVALLKICLVEYYFVQSNMLIFFQNKLFWHNNEILKNNKDNKQKSKK